MLVLKSLSKEVNGMDAVLYICHGSRVKKGCDQAIEFIERSKSKIDVPIQEVCFLELAEPTIEQGFKRCVEQGATRIAIVPILLLTAGHAKVDIPEEIHKVYQHYPHIKVVYGTPFGVDNQIVDILIERIKETEVTIKKDAMVLLVGRGSSDPEVKKDFHEIAQRLAHKGGFQHVDTCYLAATTPKLLDGLKQASESNYSQVFVLPYLLFTGILMNEIRTELKKWNKAEQEFILANYLGYHDRLSNILQNQVNKLLNSQGNEYDVYRYS